MDITKLSINELEKQIQDKKITCQEVVEFFFDRIEKTKKLNAVLETFPDAINIAKEYDLKIANGESVPKYAGIPMLIKDNILIKGKIASAGSNFLKKFVAPYNATVIEKLAKAGIIFLGRTNMDEFAMGSSTENSAYGNTLNALGDDLVPGGSSGGSATGVAASLCMAALGSDTGGSVRQPASFQGIVGSKPTYGRISRYGVIAYASSLEQVGIFSKSVEDNALIMEIISGNDKHDSTTLVENVPNMLKHETSLKGLKIGVFNEVKNCISTMKDVLVYNKFFDMLKKNGAKIVDIPFPNFELCPAVYYVIAPAEATSNLGRFDGVKYTRRAENCKNVDEIYAKSRTEGFGKEVKKRIMLGNFVLSSAYYDAYYLKAKRMQRILSKEMQESFEKCDVIMMPTAAGEAFKIGEKIGDPIAMWVEDLFTITANITGVPAISIPCGKGEKGLPLGIQIIANKLCEPKMFDSAFAVERLLKGESK
ncbi:MAG: Asp-tRNA(Asn)/Glu-tRNA(Gln) amidotransferase subunit GatA [Clostridia bacterium]